MLTQKELKQLLHYNKKTGIFIWINSNYAKKKFLIGKVAGTPDKDGYIMIGVNRITHKAHRLVFLYVKGYLPENKVDHKDRISYHNWWSNLREISDECSARNTKVFSTNKSGIKGVIFNKKTSKWEAFIHKNNKKIYLGIHDNFTEAVAHRLAAEQCLEWADCDKYSSSFLYLKEIYNVSDS